MRGFETIFLFTVDVEGMPLKDGKWDYSTVVDGIPLLLDLLEDFGICSTFFVSSDVAVKTPEAIKDVLKSKHEIGCHGYRHQPLSTDNPQRQYRTLKEATKTISDQLNTTPIGFRAPFYRVDASTLSALAKLGYKYDSSVVPSPKLISKNFFPEAPHDPYTPSEARIDQRGKTSITEIPVSTLPIFRLPLSLSFCMLFGLNLYKSLLQRFDERVMTFYLHNYDFYPIPLRAKVSPFFRLAYLRHRTQRVAMLRELLEFVISRFSPTFVCAQEFTASLGNEPAKILRSFSSETKRTGA